VNRGNNHHIFLVAFDVRASSRKEAEAHLTHCLPVPGDPVDSTVLIKNRHGVPYPETHWIDKMWVAEDDRRDGSDGDSAVFCDLGAQHRASCYLYMSAISDRSNVIPAGRYPKTGD
jgi:hypothetical protein